MRIISGELKGRTLVSAKGVDVRPVTDRVKQVIFDVFQTRLNLKNAIVLDAFCGTGSLGFEALSRGASRVVFVDDSTDSLDVLKKNISKLCVERKCDIVRSDAMNYFARCKENFNLIFADPPYAFEQTNEIPFLVSQNNLLKVNGFLVMEHSKQLEDWKTMENGQPTISFQKTFGNTIVSFFQNKIEENTK
ncbi:MAG: 16S rRNA (guanine(966)-N(2))-methyltransferase RsmD [Ignavibacteriales bacterium]|nr:16S rRNA (guanine(966)-N(2))-methyltransferase RsmD [Ignavibacteriales bacterium]